MQNILGEKIKEIRKSRNMTQEQFASLTGISAGYISEIETGTKYNVSNKILSKLSTSLNVSLDYLLSDAHETQKDEIHMIWRLYRKLNLKQRNQLITIMEVLLK